MSMRGFGARRGETSGVREPAKPRTRRDIYSRAPLLIIPRKQRDKSRREEDDHAQNDEDGYHAPQILHYLFGVSVEKETHIR